MICLYNFPELDIPTKGSTQGGFLGKALDLMSSASSYYFSSFSFKLICSTSQGKFRESKALEAVYCLSWKFPSFKDILPRLRFSSGSLATLKSGEANDNFKVLCYIILLHRPYLDDVGNSICL